MATHDSLTSDQRDSMLLGQSVCVDNLDACAELEGRTGVVVRLVLWVVLGIFKIVRPDVQCPSSRRLGSKIMACVLDDETQVKFASNVDSYLDLSNIGHIDAVLRKPADRA